MIPNKHRVVPAHEWITEAQSRLCMQDSPKDDWCPLCDQVLDTKGHHSRTCCAGGDRTRRHNSTRNQVFRTAAVALPSAELEKPGLLPPSPCSTSPDANLRRPADIYLPSWKQGSPVALDFAITAPQRPEIVASAACEDLAAATAYSQTKRLHANTEAECNAVGLVFVPMVAETTGAWSSEALVELKRIAKAAARRSAEDPSKALHSLLESTSVCIRRANAKAHLSRRSAAARAWVPSAPTV